MIRIVCDGAVLGFFLVAGLYLAGCDGDVARPDLTSPATILDLVVVDVSDSQVILEWTSPGDDEAGFAFEYDLRYSTGVFGLEDWNSLIQADSLPSPASPGSIQTTSISSLLPGTHYYFALRTTDSSGNLSELSNLASVTTFLEAPPEFVLLWGETGNGDGQFDAPHGIAIDASAHVYVVDQGNHRVQKFTGEGTFLSKWGSLGNGEGQFNSPTDIVAVSGGELLVTDTNNNRVQHFTPDGAHVGEWIINSPQQIDISGSDIYVLAWSTLFQYDLDGQLLNTWSIRKYGAWTRDIAGVGGGLYFVVFEGFPECCTQGTYGYFYYLGPYVQLLEQTTMIEGWGTKGVGPAHVNQPSGVAVDGSGNVYVADRWLNRIQKWHSDGTLVTAWGTRGSLPGQFNSPRMLTWHTGEVFVVDSGNNRIQKFRESGK